MHTVDTFTVRRLAQGDVFSYIARHSLPSGNVEGILRTSVRLVQLPDYYGNPCLVVDETLTVPGDTARRAHLLTQDPDTGTLYDHGTIYPDPEQNTKVVQPLCGYFPMLQFPMQFCRLHETPVTYDTGADQVYSYFPQYIEKVTTPAGTFDAYRIRGPLPAGTDGDLWLWFAPEVGWFVKEVSRIGKLLTSSELEHWSQMPHARPS